MASERPLAEKLQIRQDNRILLVASPPGFDIGELPPGAAVDYAPPADLVLVFVSTREEFLDRVPAALPALKPLGLIWVGYPKGRNDGVNRDVLRELSHQLGLETIALVSIDDTWSALRLKRQ